MREKIKNLIQRNFKKIPYFFEKRRMLSFEDSGYALIGKLSTSLLHDILSPLTALTLSTQMSSSPQTQTLLKHSNEQVREYVSILRNFLLNKESSELTSINQEIRNCILLIRHLSVTHNVQIQFIEFNQINAHIHPLHVYQIVINLLTNAIEASSNSETKKVILILKKEKNYLYIECKDFGLGISKEILEKIGSYNFSTKSDTRGFGLYSVSHIVHKILKGTLHVESEPNQGSLFTCKIPLFK
jgi:signal transduction histidine kinase